MCDCLNTCLTLLRRHNADIFAESNCSDLIELLLTISKTFSSHFFLFLTRLFFDAKFVNSLSKNFSHADAGNIFVQVFFNYHVDIIIMNSNTNLFTNVLGYSCPLHNQ